MAAKTSVGQTPEGKKLWRCDGCGKVSVWGRGWSWLPEVLRGWQAKHYDPLPAFVACSPACEAKAKASAPSKQEEQVDDG